MARPYSAGGVSIAESNHHAVGPLLLPLAASRHSAGLPSPVFPAPSLLLPTAITPDLGQGEEVRRRGPALGPLLCIRIEMLII